MPEGAPAPMLGDGAPGFEQLLSSLMTKLTSWLELAVTMLPNVVVALLILGLAMVAARLVSRVADRGLNRVSKNRQVNALAVVMVRVGISLAGAFAALAVLRLDGVVTSLLAGVGVIGIALGFAFQDIAANFMSGVLMAVQRPFQVGDLVESSSYTGHVERVDLRTTHLRLNTGELVLIPNKDVVNNPLKNFTETVHRRVEVDVGVAYSDDLDDAHDVIRAAVEKLQIRDADRDVEVYFMAFGESSVDLRVRFWISSSENQPYFQARSDAIRSIHRAVAENGLNIPFPIRTLDFGARGVGGEGLDSILRPDFLGAQRDRLEVDDPRVAK